MDEKLLTAEEFGQLRGLSNGLRHELVRGRVVSRPLRTWRCAEITGNIAFVLKQFVNATSIGGVSIGAGFITERGPDTVRAPDVAFMMKSRMPTSGRVNRYLDGSPDLCVEVLSEKDSNKAFTDRVESYLRTGARAVWLFRSGDRTVLEYRETGFSDVLSSEMFLNGNDVLPGFSCPVSDFFK